MKLQQSTNVQKYAQELQHTKLLAKLEAKYHRKCLSSFYNRVRQAAPKVDSDAHLHGIVLAELVAFIEDMQDDETSPVFKLAELARMYKERLEQLGQKLMGSVSSSPSVHERHKSRIHFNPLFLTDIQIVQYTTHLPRIQVLADPGLCSVQLW